MWQSRRTFLLSIPPLAAPQAGASTAFPERLVTLVVPFAPGGSTDISARVLAERMVVENRAGAGGAVGSVAVKRATPDGHTLLFASASSHGANPALVPDLRYDPLRDFAACAITGISPMALMVGPGGPRDLASLLATLADGRGAYASAGQGSIPHLATELLLRRAGRRAEHVPYRSGGQAMDAVARSEALFGFEAAATLAGPSRDGRVRLLAASTATRAEAFPDLPTVAEEGFPGFDLGTWNAVLAPAATPQPRVDRIGAAALEAVADPAVAARFAALGVQVPRPPLGPEGAARFLASEVAKFRAVAEAAGLRAG